MKTRIEIKSVGRSVLFQTQKENNTIKDTLFEAVKNGADLRGAYLGGADLGGACIEQDKDFIGIELDEKYYDISCKRIKEAIKQ